MKRSLFLAAILFCICQHFQAQTADDILMKYFEAVGGIEKWKNLKTIKMTGNMVMSQNEFPVTIYRKAPNKFKIVMNVMQVEVIPQAFDGDTGWMKMPSSEGISIQKAGDDQIRALKDISEFEDPFINYRSKGFAATYEGTGEADGIQCHIIRLIKHQGVAGEELSSLYYFDMEHYLQILIKQPNAQLNGQEIEIYLSDYKDAGNGLLMPFVMDTHYKGQSVQKLSFTGITVNEDLPDEIFRFPGVTKSPEPKTP